MLLAVCVKTDLTILRINSLPVLISCPLWLHSRLKSARLFNPGKVADLKFSATTVDSLRSFPFFKDNSQVIENLKKELPKYLASADGTPRNVDPLVWWEHNALLECSI